MSKKDYTFSNHHWYSSQLNSLIVILCSFILTMSADVVLADVVTNSIDTAQLHPDRDAIPASDFDLQQLKSLAEQLEAAAKDCGKDFKCPIMDCAAANQLLQVLLEAKRYMAGMKGWSAKASEDFLKHHNSLVEQSIITDSSRGDAIWAQGVQKFLHDFGSMLLDIAALAGTIEDLAKGGFDPSKIKNLDKLYETLKTYESLLDTVADNVDPSTATKGTGPLNDLTKDADEMLGLGNTSIGSAKSDLSDVISAIDNYKAGKPKNVGRDVGQIIGRILKDLSQAEMDERERYIGELARDLREETDVITTSKDDYSRAAQRRNLVEDTSAALDSAYSALVACINKHCNSNSSMTPPTIPTFDGWGRALRYYNALIPRIRTSLAAAAGGISFKEREDCVDPLVSLPDDPFAAVRDLPIEPITPPITVNCSGGGCPSGPITGTCVGDSCGNAFDLYCPGTGCSEEIIISCSGDTCSNKGTVDCEAGECDDVGGFSCGDTGCDAVPTYSVLDDLGYDKTNVSNLTLNTNLFPRQNTTLVPRIQTCELCQSIADQLYELDVRLNELENGQYLWDAVQDQPAEQEKLHKEAQEKKAERNMLAAKLALCQKKCPEPDDYYPPEPIEINCVGSGCTEGITGSCIGASCGETFDLYCPGTGCADDIVVSCSGDSCANEGTVDCDAGKCDGAGGFTCGDAGCEDLPPNSTPDNFISVLDDVGFDTGLGVGSATSLTPANAGCPRCEYSAQVRNELIKDFNEFEERFNRLLGWIVEAKADSIAARENVKAIEEAINKVINESSLLSYIDEKYLETSITKNGHTSTKVLTENMTEEDYSAWIEKEDSFDRKLENLKEELPKAKRDYDVKAKRFINLISKRSILLRERNELIEKLDGAAKALYACELKLCIEVELVNFISITGNPPFDPRDPIAEDSDSIGTTTGPPTGPPSTSPPTPVATINVLLFNSVFIPVSKFGAPVSAPTECFSGQQHYHGSATSCTGSTEVCPATACGCGRVSDVISIPLSSCANP